MSMLAWYWHRLKAMDATEVIGRVREKTLRYSERKARTELDDIVLQPPPLDFPKIPPASGAPSALREALARDAADIMAGRWSLYGWKPVPVSLPPQWHRDYIKLADAPTTGIPEHRTLASGADARTIWEINRWSEMVRLAMHGHVNGDATAYTIAQEWLEDWVEKNPVGEGINWTSALEAGLRLINFCWFDALVRCNASPEIFHLQDRLAQMIVPAHTWWVQRYLSFGSSANNHRLGELTALLQVVGRWPELEEITGSADTLWEKISRSLLDQFAEDGGNREQALHYHLFAMEMGLHAWRAMGSPAGPVSKRLQKAAEFLVQMTPAGEPWDYGDSDDAQIVPFPLSRVSAPTEWQAWMAGTDKRGALSYWLGDTFTSPTCDSSWWLAPQSGMAVCRHGEWQMRLDASPLGFGKLAAHGHCDALHLSIWHGTSALVIDPGTGGYFGMKVERSALASWSAHNGPQPLEGFKTPQRFGTFLWAQHHVSPQIRQEGDEGVLATLIHEDHKITRHVEATGSHDIQVKDAVADGATFRVRWHLAPGCEIVHEGAATFRISRAGKVWRLVVSGDDVSVNVDSSLASPHYYEFVPCPVLEATAHGSMTTQFTLIHDTPHVHV